jgi:uncharacterized membrane protein
MSDVSKNNNAGMENAEVFLSNLLRVGVIASAMVILTGLIMFLITRQGGYPAGTYPISLKEIITGLLLLKPFAIIITGLLLLIFTPVFRVGASIIIFLMEEDYLYSAITAIVFIILLAALILGKGM